MELGSADFDMFRDMKSVAYQLQGKAEQVLDMVIDGKVEQARKKILWTRKELTPLRLGLTESLQNLYNLKGKFIQISGVA